MKKLLQILVLMAFFFTGLNHYNLIAKEQSPIIKFQKSQLSNSLSLRKSGFVNLNKGKTNSNYEIQRKDSFDFSGHSSGYAEMQSTQTLFYGDSPACVYPTNAGFIGGPNEYGILGYYERFDFIGTGKLKQAVIYFYVEDIVGTPDSYRLVVKSVGSNGAPATTIHSANNSFSQEDEGWDFYCTYFINTEVIVSGAFFIGIEWNSTNDDKFTIKLDDSGKGDNQRRAWEKTKNGGYEDMYSKWSAGGVPLDADLWIAAVVDDNTLVAPSNGATGVSDIPNEYSLSQNYPNPFNPSTTIKFSLPVTAQVTLKIYDNMGKEVAQLVSQKMSAGTYTTQWDASGFESGVYYCRIIADHFIKTRKLLLLK